MAYEVKRTRATWDPSLAVPGTDRRGGWRCPVGTRYGGQITDRFGRNCGWGAARRLANQISDIGERLENVGDRRRGRRLERRNRQMVERLAQQARPGRVERLAGRIAGALEDNNREEAPRPVRAVERVIPEAPAVRPVRRRQGQARRRGNLRMSEERRMQREIDQPGAARTGDIVPPAAERERPAAPRARRQQANRRRVVERAVEPVQQPEVNEPAQQPELVSPPKKAAAKKVAAKKVPAKKAPAKKRVAKKVPAKKASAPRMATPPREATPPRPATPPAPPAPAPQAPERPVRGDNVPFDFPHAFVALRLRDGNQVGHDREVALGFNHGEFQVFRNEGREGGVNDVADLVRDMRAGRVEKTPEAVNRKLATFRDAANEMGNEKFDLADRLAGEIEQIIRDGRRDNKTDDEIRNLIGNRQDTYNNAIKQGLRWKSRARYLDSVEARQAAMMGIPPRPLEELASPTVIRKAQDRVDKAIKDRQDLLASYLNGRYGENQAPWLDMTRDRYADLMRRSNGGDAAAKRELKQWAEAMYSHDRITGSNGKNYRIVAQASVSPNGIAVNTTIYHLPDQGAPVQIGTSSRSINANGNDIYNHTMFIRAAAHKNAGIQTIYNQHAFMYAKAAGFKQVGVSAVDDGPYVWGRVGFRQEISEGQINRIKQAVQQFDAGNPSIVNSAEDAAIVKFLIARWEEAKRSNRIKDMPKHMDFIYAISNGNAKGSRAYKQREKDIQTWFKMNMPFSSGKFDLEENKISADPRRRQS